MVKKFVWLILVITALWAVGFVVLYSNAGGGDTDAIEQARNWINEAMRYYHEYPKGSYGVFILVLIAIAVLGFPPTGTLIIGGGAIFGILPTVALTIPGFAIAAILPFLFSRKVVSSWVEKRFPDKVSKIRDNLAEDGPFYLVSLRVLPMVPFTSINIFMGITTIPTLLFVVLTILGRFPLTVLYANAGKHLATIERMTDIFTPDILISLLALAIAPPLMRLGLKRMREKAGAKVAS
jgi:uncharacterized membrane protein YdjX (TVP38/TMEM64 family)